MSIKNRRSTSYLVEFPKSSDTNLNVTQVILTQKAYEHDVCELRLNVQALEEFANIKTLDPIKITWRQADQKREWLGYVSAFETVSAKEYLLVAIGNSFPMKTKKPVKLTGKTVSQHAKQLAKQYGLKFVGENSAELSPSSSTGAKTHFEHLTDLAKKAGFVFAVENTNLVFQSYEKTLRESSANVPVYLYFGRMMPSNLVGEDRTLDSFEVLNSEYLEDGKSLRNVKYVGGVDPITSKVFVEKASPTEVGIKTRSKQSNSVFDEQVASEVASSRTSAKALAKGSSVMARFHLPMKVVGQGDPRVRPHSLIYVSGTGKNTDGFWYVKEVTHQMSSDGQYFATILAFSDGLGDSSTFKNQSLTRNGDAVSGLLNLDAYFGSGLQSGSRSERDAVVKLPGNTKRYVENHKLLSKSSVRVPTDKTVRNRKPSFREAPSLWRTTAPSKAKTRF